MRFELGLDSFLECLLRKLSRVKDEDDAIDVFYALAGYVRACQLPEACEARAERLVAFVQHLLVRFAELPAFDAGRFAWLVEACGAHLHVGAGAFQSICEAVLREIAASEGDGDGQALQRLHQVCVISQTPCLQALPALKEAVDEVFRRALLRQLRFMQRYVYGSFVNCIWDEHATEPGPSVSLRAWRVYLANLTALVGARPAIPGLLLVGVIDDSVMFFAGYYAEVQPSRAHAERERRWTRRRR